VTNRDARLEGMCARRLKRLGVKLAVTVEWSNRLRTTAGLAYWQTLRIVLNTQLLRNSRPMARRVVLHELAHFVAYYKSGEQVAPHGAEWQLACRDVGIPGEQAVHDIPVNRRRQTPKHFYGCRECGCVLSRVKPLVRRLACLRCCNQHTGGKYKETFRLVRL